MTKIITEEFARICGDCFNIKDKSKRDFISMKNEFYKPRIMMTKSKKRYSSLTSLQEGKLLQPVDFDVKGMSIKKVDTNKKVREIYQNMIENYILKSQVPNIKKVLETENNLRKSIEESLLSGSIDFVFPAKVNSFSSYKDGTLYQNMVVRGTILWNTIYPNEPINIPDKINYIVLSINKYINEYEKGTLDIDIITDILINDDNDLDDNEAIDIANRINEAIYQNENMSKYGFKVLCFPKSLKKLPKWVIPFIDIKKSQEKLLGAGKEIRSSLGMTVLDYQYGDEKGERSSNIITF
jgi:hypothetical protein